MKFHLTQQRLGVQPVAQALYERFIIGPAAAADFQAQLRDVIVLLHFDEGIDERVEPLVLTHAREESDHWRIGSYAFGAVPLVIDPVVDHAHALGRQPQFIAHAAGIKFARGNETHNLLCASGHDFPHLGPDRFRHAVDIGRFVLQQANHRRADGFLESMRQTEQQRVGQ